MRKYTIITKDGSKWLRPVNPFDNNDPRFTSKEPFCILGMRPCSKTVCECDEWKKFEKNNPILPYIGSHPEGTAVDESEVREVRQFMIGGTIDMDDTIIEHGDWITMHDFDKARLEADLPDFLKRNAYTDAESHDRHISDDYPGVDYQPLFNHMSKVHGLTLTTSEMDEIIGITAYILK